MTEKQKLILGLMQIDSISRLLEGNEYQQYLYRTLSPTSCRIESTIKSL
jgi:hypothetical protein